VIIIFICKYLPVHICPQKSGAYFLDKSIFFSFYNFYKFSS
jgi:hypothetical protein